MDPRVAPEFQKRNNQGLEALYPFASKQKDIIVTHFTLLDQTELIK